MTSTIVQLGTVRLALHGDVLPWPEWRPVTPVLLSSLPLTTNVIPGHFDSSQASAGPSSQGSTGPSSPQIARAHTPDTCEILSSLSISRSSGFHATCRVVGELVVVRIFLEAGNAAIRSSTEKRHLRSLCAKVDRSWDGEEDTKALLSMDKEFVGMQDIYALIESPPKPSLGDQYFPGDEYVLDPLSTYENPYGVKTQLHGYQMRSIARMMKMEVDPSQVVDPAFVRLPEAGETGRSIYIDFDTMEVRLNPSRYTMPKGGILCEQMGSGKTLMCLSLILATLHQPTCLPADIYISPCTTDHAVIEYPTESQETLRSAIGAFDPSFCFNYRPRTLPSLASLCADIVATHRPDAKRDPFIFPTTNAPLSPSVRSLLDRMPVYFKFPAPSRLPRAAKDMRSEEVQKVLVTNTTLVVVPSILVPQWEAEAKEHFVEDALKIFIVPDNKKSFPSVIELKEYDVVLMSLERFKREYKGNDPNRIYYSELRTARWKRIILDEGNNANNSGSDAMRLVESMSIERRWIVSGTPTTGLKQGTEDAIKSFLESEVMRGTESGSLRKPSTDADVNPKRQQWSKLEINDADRLCNMIQGFLGANTFRTDNLRSLLLRPLRSKEGPRFGAVEKISEVMSAIMVKHRPGEIDQEVQLPPSSLSATLIKFDPWQRLTYNALMALVASNVYTSEGEDVDYFLHARNREAYNQVVENLHLANSWHCSRHMDLEKSIERTLNYMNKKQNLTPKHIDNLNEAIGHMRAALDNPAWAEWMSRCHASIPYVLGQGVSDAIKDAWSDSPETGPEYIDANSLRIIQDVASVPGTTERDIVMLGWDERAYKCEEFAKSLVKAEKEWKAEMGQVVEEIEVKKSKQLSPKRKKAAQGTKSKGKGMRSKQEGGFDEEIKSKLAAGDKGEKINISSVHHRKTQVRRVKTKDKLDAKLDEAALNALANASLDEISSHVPFEFDDHDLLPTPVPRVLQTTTKSAKINHMMRTIQTAAVDDKFVIFGQNQELAHLKEALDLAGIEATYVVAGEDKKSALQSFHKPEIKVCMLDLKVAARGLDLTIANRMIFFSPQWSLDVQAQAIKRIHRIGQSRATTVEILVTPETFEEEVLRRERGTRTNDEEVRYTRNLIEKPKFVPMPKGERKEEMFEIQLVRTPTGFTVPVTTATAMVGEQVAAVDQAVTHPIPPLTPSSASTPPSLDDTPLLTPLTPVTEGGMYPAGFQVAVGPSTPGPAVKVAKNGRQWEDANMGEKQVDSQKGQEEAPRPKKKARFADE